MTRLATDDVKSISAELAKYDAELTAKTGHSLRGVACQAAGLKKDEIKNHLKDVRVAVIPITVGAGIIAGFCDAVAGIVSHIGCETFITRTTDVAGLAEAFENKADIIILADDQQFIALHAETRQLVENAAATGKGFVAGLHLMTGEFNQKNVLVIGCGAVGQSAANELVSMQANVSIYDINPACAIDLFETLKKESNAKIQIIKELDRALEAHKFIVDASPAADIIRAEHITANTFISAPGVPIGLDRDARIKIGNRLLHDPLQIGVATMTMLAFKFHMNAKFTD